MHRLCIVDHRINEHFHGFPSSSADEASCVAVSSIFIYFIVSCRSSLKAFLYFQCPFYAILNFQLPAFEAILTLDRRHAIYRRFECGIYTLASLHGPYVCKFWEHIFLNVIFKIFHAECKRKCRI